MKNASWLARAALHASVLTAVASAQATPPPSDSAEPSELQPPPRVLDASPRRKGGLSAIKPAEEIGKDDYKPAVIVPSLSDEQPPAAERLPIAVPRKNRFAARPPAAPMMEPPAGVETSNRRVEQNVSLEWICPTSTRVKQPFLCEMVVRNLGTLPAMNVLVRNSPPDGMKIVNSEPKAATDGEVLTWSLGAIEPRQERRIRLEVVADRRGEIGANASVSATTPASSKIKICEPQLVIRQVAPERVMVGDQVLVALTASNPGDGPTDPVVLRTRMTEGLRGGKSQEAVSELGVLAAGETRLVKVSCLSVRGGAQRVSTIGSAESGLEANAESNTLVSEAKLELAMTGPKLRYLDRAATYKLAVTNPGDAAAADVKISVVVPAGFKFSGQPVGGKYDPATRTVSWFVGSLAPGEKKEVSYKCLASQAGEFRHMASVEAARGMKAAGAVATKVEGIASLLMEMVDVDDPIEVGAETSYEIRITNQGSREATNVEIRALVPREMSVKGGQGPTTHKVEGQEVIFAPLPKLAPRADAIFRVFVKAQAAGDVRFRARLVSDALSEPVIGEEGTKIYTDEKN